MFFRFRSREVVHEPRVWRFGARRLGSTCIVRFLGSAVDYFGIRICFDEIVWYGEVVFSNIDRKDSMEQERRQGDCPNNVNGDFRRK
jgi:hypothetical protein